MSGEGQAAGEILTGGLIAAAIEGESGITPVKAPAAHAVCRNCGAMLSGAFCSACGQRAHLHRSLLSLAHDLLHGLLHLEGKIWRTLPELLLHPGRLTRRYVAGERVKFVSPMALYLFTVFLMFAAFSFTTSDFFERAGDGASRAVANMRDAFTRAEQENDARLATLRAQLAAPDLSDEQRATLTQQLGTAEKAFADLQVELRKLDSLMSGRATSTAKQPSKADDVDPVADIDLKLGLDPKMEDRFKQIVRQVLSNPGLTLYKIKAASYKYSWALIPLSVPFVWLLFFWRRDLHLYDHAIFVTYSISFMMLFLAAVSLAAAYGVSAGIWGTALAFVPPIHIYRQLRHAYSLGRFGAWLRLVLLLMVISFVLTIFVGLLFIVGLLG